MNALDKKNLDDIAAQNNSYRVKLQDWYDWCDMSLATALKAAIEEIEALRQEVEALKAATSDYVTVEEFNAYEEAQ